MNLSIDPLLRFLSDECNSSMTLSETHLMTSFTNLFDSLLTEEFVKKDFGLQIRVNFQFVFALIWSFGGHLTETDRSKFDTWAKRNLAKIYEFPEDENTVYDYCLLEGTVTLWKSSPPLDSSQR